MVKPAFEIKMVRENLDLSMALLQAVGEEKVTAKQLFRNGPDDMFVAFAVDNQGPSQIELTRRAANQTRAAFALAVIQTQRSLDRVFKTPPIPENSSGKTFEDHPEVNPDLQAARCVMFLLNNTVAPNLFSPVWNCPPQYRRQFEVRPISLLLDAELLHGKALSWDHVGGLHQFLDLLVYFANCIEDLPELEKPAGAASPTPARNIEEAVIERRDGSVGPASDSERQQETLATPPPAAAVDAAVARFVAERCKLGSQNLVIAKDLYADFQEWCRGSGLDDVSQRSFGMQLTAMGLQRRRRGRGKHWWDGIRLSGQVKPELEEELETANGRYGGFQPELTT
ncbi:MAG: primase-like DNA-binding domain-containing protein [Chloroflexi bacterium]|nr:primase-like DNA-binding domain-containing protein [Chloroflexota bacterium]MDA1270146.1 primase-like DNA-binding domain-containing protein [Chloroflexota bacterium]